MKMNSINVSIVLNSGDRLTGEVNILEFKRFSDFIEQNSAKHIKLFNTKLDDALYESAGAFLLIPKTNIRYYIPLEETKTE
ncbi:MAG: hypothetical protein RQ739_05350 [Desulfotignum sp.]|jgi:hypothetical protein|nr:hypothetical protein [Desulfotignum sp.]